MVQSVRSSGKSRESSFEPVRRLIFLHNLLKRSTAGRRLTAQRATEQMNASGFEVSLRTVQRYLEQCEQHFSGIRRDNNKPCGWWLESNSQDDALQISKEAALALCLAEAHLKHLIPSAELKHLTPLFQHARKTVEFGGEVNRYKRMIDRIWIFPRGLQLHPPRVDSQIFDRIMAALLESRELEIEYKKTTNQASSVRTIEPLGIVERSGVYYVIGREKYAEFAKNWAMHRIRSIKEGSYFSYPKGFRVADYARTGNLNVQFEPKQLSVQMRFSPAAGAHLLESRLCDNQQTSILPDGRIEIQGTVANSIEFRWWLMGLAPECEILEPVSLREEIYRMLLAGLKNFTPPSTKKAG